MKKSIRTSELIGCEKTCFSITVTPIDGGFNVRYFTRELCKSGKYKRRNVKVKAIIEDAIIQEICNKNVIHLGYNTYKHLVQPSGFYINLYYN